jgi:hypothetical protein
MPPSGTRPAAPATKNCQSGWHVGSEPFAPEDHQHRLYAIAASSFDDAWAVGERLVPTRVGAGDGLQDRAYPLIEHWDGSTWTVVPVPAADPNHAGGSLYAVTVFAPDDAWAVGRLEDPEVPLAEHWDGVNWTAAPVPPLTDSPNNQLRALVDVAGDSASDAWALALLGKRNGAYANAILHWNGKAWTHVAAPAVPNTSTADIVFTRLSVDASTGYPWIAGAQLHGIGELLRFDGAAVESWNGHGWTGEQPPDGTQTITAISSAGDRDVWALRGPDLHTPPLGSGGASPNMVQRWDGKQWKTLLSTRATLNGLGIVSSQDVWLAGIDHDRPVLMRWNGTSWTTVESSPPVALPDGLVASGVANDHTLLAFGVTGTTPEAVDSTRGSEIVLWAACPDTSKPKRKNR